MTSGRMGYTSSWYLVVLGFVSLVFGQDNRQPDPNNYFVYPGLPGPQFSNDPSVYGKNINITYGVDQSAPFKWMTNLTHLRITMNQEGNPNIVHFIELIPCSPAGDNFVYWDGDLGPIDVKQGNVAFLAAWNCTSGGEVIGTPLFFSHYFNLTAPPQSQQSSSQTTSTQTSTSQSTATSASQTSITAVSSSTASVTSLRPSATQSPSPSTSNVAAIGGGIGGGLGGALLILGLVFLFLRHQKSKRKERHLEGHSHHGDYQDYNDYSNLPIVTQDIPPTFTNNAQKSTRGSFGMTRELQGSQLKQNYLYNYPSELSSNT